jgi:hypothetical protein
MTDLTHGMFLLFFDGRQSHFNLHKSMR